ncbi:MULTISPECIES: DUF2267 domain-containing protein [unclassified Leptolyngbya]|uniref:DUF2267 domain-containing protein n=1 Tax=unclassified Leptolyngbya TaxID=2650499 RepID=UPI001687E1B2|nr:MULTISPECIES: DUF2267 domain-containing protein [unclassified Leptolyngbya]MBD1913987.1 DUF2267 domain-containing protein [Leptolyngbya sp. FACHB-8]MBD2154397.1 DUF2267 domain-containing protein [Leptolyngbya sp. FACHB-16]
MKYDEFIKEVQGLAQLDSRQAAEQATRATLETIAERIVGNEASQLADQLPKELGQYLRGHEGENGGFFSLKEFYERVSQKAGIDPVAAALQVRAIFMVLNEAVTPGEFADVRANFSDDYSELFATPGKV